MEALGGTADSEWLPLHIVFCLYEFPFCKSHATPLAELLLYSCIYFSFGPQYLFCFYVVLYFLFFLALNYKQYKGREKRFELLEAVTWEFGRERERERQWHGVRFSEGQKLHKPICIQYADLLWRGEESMLLFLQKVHSLCEIWNFIP